MVDNACVGGAVLKAVEAGTVAVAGERVTVPLETLADIANDDYSFRFATVPKTLRWTCYWLDP